MDSFERLKTVHHRIDERSPRLIANAGNLSPSDIAAMNADMVEMKAALSDLAGADASAVSSSQSLPSSPRSSVKWEG